VTRFLLWFDLFLLWRLEVLINDIDYLTVRSHNFVIPLFPLFLRSVINVKSVLMLPRWILHSCVILSLNQGIQAMF
jgi:hypothetical protein